MADITVGAKDLLVTAGVGTFGASTGWSIHIGEQQGTPDTTVTIYPSGGRDPFAKWLLDFPSLQVRVRGAKGDYVSTRTKAQEVKDALHSLPSQAVNGDQWMSVLMRGDITHMGRDKNDRPEFVLNFDLRVEPASGTNRLPL